MPRAQKQRRDVPAASPAKSGAKPRRPANRATVAARQRRLAPFVSRRSDPREHPAWNTLSPEQKRAAALLHDTDKSLVVCGSAGTGKSFFIDFVSKVSDARVTATTACAASLIGGVTLHSLLRWVPDEDYREWCKYVGMVRLALVGVQILIIDEAFMLGDADFGRLDCMLKRIAAGDMDRKDRCTLPFGGFRLVLVGDPLQLPPVNGRQLFLSKAYAELAPTVVMLRRIFRQTTPLYLHMLGALRFGYYTPLAVLTVLLLEYRAEHLVAAMNALHLFSVRKLRDQHNFDQVRFYGQAVQFERSWALGIAGPGYYRADGKVVHVVGLVEKEGRLPPDIPSVFAVGCPVRIMRNINPEAGLVNGTFATVVSIQPEQRTVTVRLGNGSLHELAETAVYGRVWRLSNGHKLAEDCIAIPAELAFAATVHAAQGATAPGALRLDTTHPFVSAPLVYVGASRSRTLENLFPRGMSGAMARVRPNTSAIAFLEQNGVDLAAERDLLTLESAEMLPNFVRLACDEMNLTHEDAVRALRAVLTKQCLRMRVTPAVPWTCFRADFERLRAAL